jgi:hypothetical protein
MGGASNPARWGTLHSVLPLHWEKPGADFGFLRLENSQARPGPTVPAGMKISGHGAAVSYAAHRPKPVAAQPVRSDEKLELKPADGFASTQLPPGVGESLNIKA